MLRILALCLAFALPAMAQDKPSVVTVNYPLAYITERLLGDAAEVVMPVPTGADPSFWRPSIADISAMQGADAVLLNGAGFAGWVTKASLSRSKLIDTSRGIEDQFIATEVITHSHGDGGEHSHDAVANYLWLDLALMSAQADTAARGLARRLDGVDVEAGLAALQADLAALDAEAKALAEVAAGRTIFASHPRYQYLARAYGLEIEALEWDAGAAPDEAQLADFSDRIAGSDDVVFLWEATPPEDARAAMAGLGVTDMVFSPMATAPEDGDFLSVFQAQVEELAGVLGGE